MVGFNRRFAPLVERLQEELGRVDDLVLSMRVNAGPLPDDHWLHDPGGRRRPAARRGLPLRRSALLIWRARPRSRPTPSRCLSLDGRSSAATASPLTSASITQSGRSSIPAGAIPSCRRSGSRSSAVAWRQCSTTSGGSRLPRREARQWKSAHDKGHRAEIARFLAMVRGEVEGPAVETYLDSTRLTLILVRSLQVGEPVEIGT